MGLRKLILLSLFALPLSLGAETASDYINRGAQKYIFGHEEAAKAEVDAGLTKFPDDPELREMLALFKKKPPQDKKDQKNDNKDKDDQDKSKKDSSNGSDQNQDKDKATPTPSPSEEKQQGGGEESPTPTPGSSPSEGESPSPSPTP